MARRFTGFEPTLELPTLPELDQVKDFSPEAKALWDRVTTEWELTPVVETSLKLICEALTKRQICDEIVKQEGITCRDARGSAKAHPAADLSYKWAQAAQAGITRLLTALD